jgi:hypothetical protein
MEQAARQLDLRRSTAVQGRIEGGGVLALQPSREPHLHGRLHAELTADQLAVAFGPAVEKK